MLRLLQGDVSSGKTVVAALAYLQAVESGRQVALMALTDLLSEQHRRSLRGWLEPLLGLDPLWLTGRHKGRERVELVACIVGGGDGGDLRPVPGRCPLPEPGTGHRR